MRTKKLGLTLLSLVMAIALVLGVTTFANTVKAEDPVTTVTMQNGARIRIEEGAPALVYTAVIENYDDSKEYGMLLVPSDMVSDVDYVATLDVSDYQKIECAPYGSDVKKITAYFDVAQDKLTANYAGIAYIYDGTNYVYTEVTQDNVRSVEYVAQMAYLKGDGDADVLASFISSEINEELYGVNSNGVMSNEVEVKDSNTYLSLIVDNLNEAIESYDGSTELSFRSTEPYAGGSTVEFDIYVPAEVSANYWVQFGTSTSKNTVDFYGGTNVLGVVPGEWRNVTCTIPEGADTYYFYITANKSQWNNGAEENPILYGLGLDNFVVTEPNGSVFTQDFENGYNGGDDETTVNFTVRGNDYKNIAVEDVVKLVDFGGSITLSGPIPELAMKYSFGVTEALGMITKESYAGGSKIEFKYKLVAENTNWWGVAYNADSSVANNYHAAGINDGYYKHVSGGSAAGEWQTLSFTLEGSDSYYLYFGFAYDNWSAGGYILIDDFKVNGTVVENFNHGVSNSVFKVLQPSVVSNSASGEGYYVPPFAEGEHAMKIYQKDHLGIIPGRTTNAYPGGSTVSFKYLIPEETTVPSNSWWRTSYSSTLPSTEGYQGYYEATHITNTMVVGSWTTVSLTLPTDADSYYVFIVTEEGNIWSREDGVQAYVLIDDLTVVYNGETIAYENFNKGLADENPDCLYTVVKSDSIGLAIGEGHVTVPFVPGEHSAKLDFTSSFDLKADTFVTKATYPGGSEVSFKYNIPEETTIGSWWAFCWDTSITGDSFWAVGNGLAEGRGGANPTGTNKTSGTGWQTYTVTLPGDSSYSYYLFFNGYQNWDGYVLIDDFTVGSVTEDFYNGVEGSIFSAGGYVSNGEGYVTPGPGEKSAKIYIDQISTTVSTPSFITKQAYTLTEETIVTLDFFMSGNTTPKWWTLAWTNDNTVADVYCQVGNNKANNDARDLPINLPQDSWQTASITVPAGTWYFYIAGAVNEWNGGYVIIDNFKIGDVATENFNNGVDYGIFVDNLNSNPSAITLVDDSRAEIGKDEEDDEEIIVPEEPEEVTFDSLVEDGTIMQYVMDLENRNYWATNVELDFTLASGSLVYNVNFDLSYDGTREFVIVLDVVSFLYFDGTDVSLYQNGECVSTIEDISSNVDLAFKVDGSLIVNANGKYVYMGQLDVEYLGTVAFISLFGDGDVTISNLKLATYKAEDQA